MPEQEFRLPQFGMQMTEATIEEWLVADDAIIAKGQEIATISTDKVDGALEAPASRLDSNRCSGGGDGRGRHPDRNHHLVTMDNAEPTRLPLTRMRRAIARSMTASAHVPQFTVEVDVRLAALADLRRELKRAGRHRFLLGHVHGGVRTLACRSPTRQRIL